MIRIAGAAAGPAVALALALGAAPPPSRLAAEGGGGLVPPGDPGEVGREEGLAAWERIHAVVSHPRCANCHVDEGGIPMWTGPSHVTPGPHGMNIAGGESRMGVELLPCATCHVTSALPNLKPHAAPHAGLDWRLAPAEMVWFGRTAEQICDQLRDPARNGGREAADLVEHITHDAEASGFIAWGFAPGGGREAAPGSLQAHLDDMAAWTAAGMPCPQD